MTSYGFPVASHSYFHVANQAAAREQFLRAGDSEPVFVYSEQLNDALIAERLERVAATSFARQSLEVVRAGARLQYDDSPAALVSFREANAAAFGEPKQYYVEAILHHAAQRVRPDTTAHWEYIQRILGSAVANSGHDGPSANIFERYKQYFEQYIGDATLRHSGQHSLVELLQLALEATGLSTLGWTVETRPGTAHARVHHHRRCITVGAEYVPRTARSAMQIVAHEVYGHALRGPRASIAEGEGFALVLEQLLGERFAFRRSYRYLAAALGWGVGRPPMTFRQVYEIVWRVMVIMRRYTEADARCHAFDECARVFRGGRPDIAGAVYLKDSIYFSANLTIWERLGEAVMPYNEFIDVIEGRREVL